MPAAAASKPNFGVPPEAPHDCPVCPRLVAFREANRAAHPNWHNGPVDSFGDLNARFLIVGLAPGLQGANRTGRPFTGDYAGDLLYSTLDKYGFRNGAYRADPQDGMTLTDTIISNAVRCVPPENKPTGAEIIACRPFLTARVAALPRVTVIVALGRIAHESIVRTLNAKPSAVPFGHARRHVIASNIGAVERTFVLHDSYHCSRYNTNTGRLTEAMFHAVFAAVRADLDAL